MTTRLDNRQARQRNVLDQVSTNADLKLDTILNLINDEITSPLRLRQSNPTNLRLNIDAISVTTADSGEGHGRTRTIQPIQGVLPSFTPGYVEFPSASGGSIVASGLTLAASYTLTVTSGNWIKVGIALNSDGQVVLTFGTTGASESAAGLPEFETGTLSIGYVSLQNSGGTIQNVTGARIYQFAGGGGGGSSSGSGLKNYLEAWYDSNKTPTVVNGGVSATGNRTAALTSWASPNTANFSFQRVSSTTVRGAYSYETTGGSSGSAAFIESPTFTLDLADREDLGGFPSRYLSIAFDAYRPGASATFEVALVRYNSSQVFQEEKSFGTFTTARVFPSSFTEALTSYATGDLVALRIRRTVGSGQLTWDRTLVSPDQVFTNGRQQIMGQKVFYKGVQTLNTPKFPGVEQTDIIPVGETRSAGRLVVPTSTTIQVDGDLTTVGSVTGPGMLTGSGTITSI